MAPPPPLGPSPWIPFASVNVALSQCLHKTVEGVKGTLWVGRTVGRTALLLGGGRRHGVEGRQQGGRGGGSNPKMHPCLRSDFLSMGRLRASHLAGRLCGVHRDSRTLASSERTVARIPRRTRRILTLDKPGPPGGGAPSDQRLRAQSIFFFLCLFVCLLSYFVCGEAQTK